MPRPHQPHTQTAALSDLRNRLRGDLIVDPARLRRFATDQSIYCVTPAAAVGARDADDIVATLRFAAETGLPVTARAGASNTAGSALGRGLVLLTPRTGPLARIEQDPGADARTPAVRVGAGVLHDDLQRRLRHDGQFLPADPSSGNMSFIGGNLATKASGPHAFRNGSIDRYTHSVRFVTAEGAWVDTSQPDSIPTTLRAGLETVRNRLLASPDLRARFAAREGIKTASGYNLYSMLHPEHSIATCVTQLLVGSVGTLGILLDATLLPHPYDAGRSACLLLFRHLREAAAAVQHIRRLDVAAIELVGSSALAFVRRRMPGVKLPDEETHLLLVECVGPSRKETAAHCSRLVRQEGYAMVTEALVVEDADEQASVWQARKALLPAIRAGAGDAWALSVVNDVGVPVDCLAEFVQDIELYFERSGLAVAIYGHAGSGNLHVRPLFPKGDPDLPRTIARVADYVYERVCACDGTITAEHGMGRLRAPYLEREWGSGAVAIMRAIKNAFDPQDILNPGAMFAEAGVSEDLRPELSGTH